MTIITNAGLSITFGQAQNAGACTESVRTMSEHLGGINAYGRDTPIPLTTVLDVLGLDDALWALFVADETRWRHLACDYATRVLPIFEARFPKDTRPRDAITYYRDHPARPAADAMWAADAAWAGGAMWAARAAWAAGATWAARAARAARAAGAAWAARAARAARAAGAARAAEREWQIGRYRQYVTCVRRPQALALPPRTDAGRDAT